MGSEGRAYFDTGVNFMLSKNWVLRAMVAATAYDFEEGNPGDSDYYKYEATEVTAEVGISFLF